MSGLQHTLWCATRAIFVEDNYEASRAIALVKNKASKPTWVQQAARSHDDPEKEGLLRGERTQVVRGRMPEALVKRAKKRTGINSDTDLIEVAHANIAVEDDYADWLLSRRGAVGGELDIEF